MFLGQGMQRVSTGWARVFDPVPRARWDRRTDGVIVAVLAVANLAVRWPLRARYLATWDSVLFALALEDYDVGASRPHPPGYPVYIALGRGASWVTTDANAALVSISLLLTVGSVVLLYGFMRRLGSRRAAVVGATLYSLAPFLLLNSVIATSYAADALFSIALAWLAWEHLQRPTVPRAVVLGAVFALSVGVRQSMLFFLSPLVAWSLLAAQGPLWTRVRQTGAAACAALVVAITWAVPMVVASGGLRDYLSATSAQSGQVVFANTVYQNGAAAWADLWPRFRYYVSHEVILLWTLLVLAAATAIALRRRGLRIGLVDLPKGAPALLALWLLPALLFYLTVFNGWGMGPPGYILVLLPGFYALFAWIGDGCVARLGSMAPHHTQRVAVLGTVLLLLPALPLAAAWDETLEAPVEDHDAWADRWMGLRDEYPPETTGIVAWWNWAHAMWYFPEHKVWSYLPFQEGPGGPAWVFGVEAQHHRTDLDWYRAIGRGPDGTRHNVTGIDTVILFDFQLAGENGAERRLKDDVPVREEFLSDGWRVLVFDTVPERPFIQDYFTVPSNVAID